MTPRVLYIGGEGRSGTTLLDQVLGQLPDVAGVGELFLVWQHGIVDNDRCGCGEPFDECPVWTEVGKVAFGGWDTRAPQAAGGLRHDLVRDRFAPWLLSGRWHTRPADGAALVTTLQRLYEAIHTVTGASVIVDSSKFAGYAMALQRIPGIDLRVVQLVRDPRGVAYSWTKVVAKPEATGGEVEMDRYSPATTAARWVKTDALFRLLRRRTGTPVLTERYEDLIADPHATIERIAAFGGLDVDGALGFVDGATLDLAPTHTVAGNPSRFRTGTVPLRLDEAWREALPARDRRLVSAITAASRRSYGYR